MTDQIDITAAALRADEQFREKGVCDVIEEEADRRHRIIEAFLRTFISDLVSAAKTQLVADHEIWRGAKGEWGTGIKRPGYKERVAQRFEQWGIDHSPSLLDQLEKVEEQTSVDDTGMLNSLTEI